MSLQVHVSGTRPGGPTYLRVVGTLAGEDVRLLREKLRQIYPDSNNTRLNTIIDLTDVDYVDSGGFGVLVSGLQRAKGVGGDISVVATSNAVLHDFELLGLNFKMFGRDKAFAIHRSAEQALRSVGIEPDPAMIAHVLGRKSAEVAEDFELAGGPPSARAEQRLSSLAINSGEREGRIVIELGGSLDIYGAREFLALAGRLSHTQPPPRVIVDLDGLQAIDAAGHNALLGADSLFRRHCPDGMLGYAFKTPQMEALDQMFNLRAVVTSWTSVAEGLADDKASEKIIQEAAQVPLDAPAVADAISRVAAEPEPTPEVLPAVKADVGIGF